ncbi:MAG TPA: hypothetical protein VGB12_09385 [bacterium]
METFDLVVMVVGGFLIAAGFLLFVTGKVAGSNNKIEAFGIKMDVSNPSLILLAAGIGLLLVPRLLPANRNAEGPAPAVVATVAPAPQAATPAPAVQETPAALPQAVSPPVAATPQPAPAPPALPATPSLAGNYLLASFTENGVYTNYNAVLTLNPTGQNRYGFYSAFQVFNQFGGVQTLEYQGQLIQRGGAWAMSITASNDPNWYGPGELPLGLQSDGDTLELRYRYAGSQIAAVWERQ